MSWSLAGNLECRTQAIKDEYPGAVVYSIGDQQHQSGQSDHNPDAREVVHAIDAMNYDNAAMGAAIRDWALSDTADLEYVIHHGKIYERDNGWAARTYTGSDPHNDHVHISGKHGNTGYTAATGTGYDTNAEKMCPEGFDTMTPDQVKQAVLDALNAKVDWQSNGVEKWAQTTGNGNPISHRMMQEHMWARAAIDNPPMVDPSPVLTALTDIENRLTAIEVALTPQGPPGVG